MRRIRRPVTDRGDIAHWPGGLVLAFPAAGTVNGTLVLAPGDVNLTFKEYVRTPIRCRSSTTTSTSIDGDGVDAELFESYLAAFGEPEAYAVSHVGWGMNAACRWESLALYDKADTNGTELRAFAGNFLYSTGANEVAGRFAAATSTCRCGAARSPSTATPSSPTAPSTRSEIPNCLLQIGASAASEADRTDGWRLIYRARPWGIGACGRCGAI